MASVDSRKFQFNYWLGQSIGRCGMSRIYVLRCTTFVFVAILMMPMMMSCSGRKNPDEAKKGEPDKTIPDDPEAIRLSKAIADSTDAIRLRPKEVNDRGELPHYQRGRVYAQKGEHDKAIADYTESIRLYPIVKGPYLRARLVEAFNARGESYMKTREYDKAVADFTEVIAVGHGFFKDFGEALVFGGFAAQAHYKRGICYDEKGDHTKAMADYEEAVRLGPDLKDNEDLKKRMSK